MDYPTSTSSKRTNKKVPSSTKHKHFEQKQNRAVIKHLILRKYLEAWFPIMSQGQYAAEKIIFVDGFAGTGSFKKGEHGSPVIALKALLENKRKHAFKSKIVFICIEKDKKNARKLRNAIANCKDLEDNLDLISVKVKNDSFEDAMQRILNARKYRGFPMVLFADPFGYSQMPMELLNRVMSRPRTDVFVNVMDGFAQRFLEVKGHRRAITRLIGSTHWIEATKDVDDSRKKLLNLIKCYTDNMEAKYTLKFAMKNHQNRHTYHLVFGTNHVKGREIMKRAMASASQDIECFFYSEFCNKTIPRIDTRTKEYKLYCVKRTIKMLLDKYKHNTHNISGAVIDEFIWNDTPYISNFKILLKSRLKELDEAGKIEVTPSRKFENIQVRFCCKPKTKVRTIYRDFTNDRTPLHPVSNEKLLTPKKHDEEALFFQNRHNQLQLTPANLKKTPQKRHLKRSSDAILPPPTLNVKKRQADLEPAIRTIYRNFENYRQPLQPLSNDKLATLKIRDEGLPFRNKQRQSQLTPERFKKTSQKRPVKRSSEAQQPHSSLHAKRRLFELEER